LASAQSAPLKPTLIPARIVTNPWIVLLVLTLGFFMILLDTTIVNVAIPAMEKGLNASFDSILWVLNGYVLVYATLLITAGRLGDSFGPKLMFIIGLAIFTASSAACAFSDSGSQLILFRVVQGFGGAILTPQTLSMLPHVFPPEKRGAAFGIWGAVSGLAAVIGPTLGGFLVTNFSWQSIFYINIPVGILAITSAVFLMPEVRSATRHSLDIPGVVLATAGLLLVLYAIIEGQKYNWGPIQPWLNFSTGPLRWGLISIYSLIVYGVVVLAAFVWVETRVAEPLLPISLFHDRNFTVSNLTGSAVGFAIFSLWIPLTLFLQTALGYTAIHAGLTMIPASITLMLSAAFAGRLADRINGKFIIMAGLGFASLGVALLAHAIALNNTSWSLTFPLAVVGLGMGCTFPPMLTLALRDVNPALSGVASGFITTTRQAAGAVGAAIVGATLTHSLASNLPARAADAATALPPIYRKPFVDAFRAAASGAQNLGAGQSHHVPLPAGVPPAVASHIQALSRGVFDTSFLDATRPSLLVVVGALIIGAAITTQMRGGRTAGEARRDQPASKESEPELVAVH
jgi:EmrB/QacA subfamily drug resistance transporter